MPAPTQSATGNAEEAHLGRGYDALKQDRYEVAAKEFRAALALNPRLVLRAQFPLAVALFESHQYDQARKEFEAVRHVVGDHPNVLYYLGRLDIANLDFAGAIENLTKASAKPPFPDTAYYLGFAYFKQGDLASAEKWLQEAAKANPTDARVQYQLGLVYRKEGKEEEAKKAVALSEQQRQRDDLQSRLKVECAQKLDQGPRAAAEAICDQLYDANDADKLTALGVLYGQHGDLQAALKPLRRAADLSPQSPQMQYNLALVYYQLNQFDDARAPLEQALKRWPDLFQLNALYGAVLMKLGDAQAAYPILRHAQDLNPQDREVGNLLYFDSLGLADKRQADRQYSDALTFLQEAAKVRPLEPEPHRRMAEIYKLTDHSAQAESELHQASHLARDLGNSP
jgi:Flp pilus assembly protein TadD